MDNKVIVFGCNHQNMLGLVRSLGEKGIHPYCICLKSNDGLVFRSRYPADCFFAESPEVGFEYIISRFSKETEKPILLSSDDVTETLFDKNASALREFFFVPACKEDGKVTYLMDKQHIGEFANQYGFTTPRMVVVYKNQVIPDNLIYPVFTKSRKSIDGGKKEERKCCNKEELEQALQSCKSDSLLVMQFIDKKTEYCIQGFAANGVVYIPYYMQYLRFSETAFGGYSLHKKLVDKMLVDGITRMMTDLQFDGLFSVEFLVDKSNNLFFTEVNFRHDGAAYHSTRGGANLPYLYCNAIIGRQNHPIKLKNSVIGMDEIKDWKQSVATGKISVFKWFYQFLKADSHKIANIRDNGPLFFLIEQVIIQFFRKKK